MTYTGLLENTCDKGCELYNIVFELFLSFTAY
jgi:hypothetical protein